MKCTCKNCGDEFTVDKETSEAIFEGYAERPDQCDECFDMYNCGEAEMTWDSDSGL
jgi:hypothetical protein